eukprot:TRINITY_DN4189_c1_g1_i1.p1 TRINITY_DN4189_c1_g1~~TRINITY_DN4189_c1_g1_i1.p1  ORF type:complete len:451 (+),score=70.58 TRINITY_DN4189_c1_g1_i1:31-1353(+)
MHKYKLLGRKGEGTFSAVLKAQCTTTDRSVAIKCMKNQFESVEQVNRLREIQALRKLSPHANIIKLFEVLYDRSTGRLALVFELMDMDLYELIKGRKQYLPEDKVLHITYQLMRAIQHMHRNAIFHRDIKPENVLISGDTLKLADFGSCRGIYSRQPFTEYIATRWYRAPECLLTDGYYAAKMDMWSAGCVLFEIIALYPLFPGSNELDQLHRIHKIMGTPPDHILNKLKQNNSNRDIEFPKEAGVTLSSLISHASPDAIKILEQLLEYDPEARISSKKIVRHQYFKELRELDRMLRKSNGPAADKEKERGEREKETEIPSVHSHHGTHTKRAVEHKESEPSSLPSLGPVRHRKQHHRDKHTRDPDRDRDRDREREREKEKEAHLHHTLQAAHHQQPHAASSASRLPDIAEGPKYGTVKSELPTLRRQLSVDCLTSLGKK